MGRMNTIARLLDRKSRAVSKIWMMLRTWNICWPHCCRVTHVTLSSTSAMLLLGSASMQTLPLLPHYWQQNVLRHSTRGGSTSGIHPNTRLCSSSSLSATTSHLAYLPSCALIPKNQERHKALPSDDKNPIRDFGLSQYPSQRWRTDWTNCPKIHPSQATTR